MTASEFAVEQTWDVNREGPGRWILSHVLRYKLIIIGVFVGAFGNAALSAVVPVLTGQAFEAIMASSSGIASLRQAAILIAVSQLVRGGLQLMRNYSSETLGQRIERDIRDELYASLIGKSMSFHDSYPSGDLMARASNDVREVNFMFNPGINLVIGSANFIIVPLIIAPQLHPQLIIIPIIYMLTYVFVVRNYLGQLQPAAESVRSDFGKMNTSLAEAIEGIETVKGAAQEKYEIHRFRQAVSRWRNSYIRQAKIEARFIPLLLLGLLQASGLFHSLELFRAGAVDVGDVVSFNGLLLMFGFPTWAAQFAYSRVASGMASSRRLLEIITARTDLDQNVTGYTEKMRGAVTFENVTFCYEPAGCESGDSLATLSNISFQVQPGQTVAVVGQTGSGKSTIAKLINRIYDVNSGRVLVDGVDVRDWNLEALRRQISIIEQDIFLFSRSIADNIAFGYPEADRQTVIGGAKSAQAHEFITGFKEGYDTVVGERGTTLSGGQRQRLALARAFLTDPAILILDDATSAIDSATEDRIQRAIEQVAENRTTFLITHRLSQIRWADLIIVMRKGYVAAVGTHDILMETSKEYRNIFARYE